ncbi:hypothetical protein Tco_0761580 [Tanacetum coccineum]
MRVLGIANMFIDPCGVWFKRDGDSFGWGEQGSRLQGCERDRKLLGRVRKIDDIDKDAEITLVDETQGRCGDDLMFDTGVLDDEEVFAGQDMRLRKRDSMWLGKRK